MAVISERRGPVIGVSLLVWLVALRAGRPGQLAIGSAGSRSGSPALSIVYLPLLLLVGRGARTEPGQPNSCW